MPFDYQLIIRPAADAFGDFLKALDRGVQDALKHGGNVANDTVQVMQGAVTRDTSALANSIRVMERSEAGDATRYVLGGDAKNRSGREYAWFEHARHAGNSFYDQGERFANDHYYRGVTTIINSLN